MDYGSDTSLYVSDRGQCWQCGHDCTLRLKAVIIVSCAGRLSFIRTDPAITGVYRWNEGVVTPLAFPSTSAARGLSTRNMLFLGRIGTTALRATRPERP